MWFGGRHHSGQQGQQGGEDQGGSWHKDVSLRLEFSSTRIWCAVVIVVSMRVVYISIMSDHIKYMRVGGQGHCGRQGQQGGEDQGGHWHKDVSLRLEFSSSRIWYAVVVVVAWKFLILSTYRTTFSISELAVDGTVVSKVNSEKKIREVADIRMYHIRWNFLQLGYDMLWWWWLTSKFLYFQLVWQP